MAKERQLINLRLEPDVIAFLDKEARSLGLTRNAFVQMVFKLKMAEAERAKEAV